VVNGWRVAVDREARVGSGMCVGSVPARFRLTDDRAQVVGDGAVEPDDALLDAADSCLGEAITVHDDGTGELLAPL
jgi:ferredoxin